MKGSAAVCTFVVFACTLCLAARTPPKVPDLTAGENPNSDKSYSMGPTGFEGWMWNNGRDSSLSRQILVTGVDADSPADGRVEKGDVILGASGTGDPAPFNSDARKALAAAITAAEARDPALLKLLLWRQGTTRTITLTLETMGAYAETAPYGCEKSKQVLAKGLEYFYEHGEPRFSNLNALLLMAANDPENPNNDKYQAKAREWVYALIPSDETMAAMLGDFSKVHSSKPAWTHTYNLIVLTEYYLQTGDRKVLPAIEAHAVCYAKGQSWIGTTGHGYADKRPDGGFNGPMSGYGAINGTGVAGFLGLVLARKCGFNNPEIAAAIDRADLFFGHFAFRGGIPYGEYGPGLGRTMYDWNGKHATTALAFSFQPERVKEAQYFAKMTACSGYDRAYGHAGPFFNYMWPALGAATGGEKLAAHYFRRTRWDHELARKWNGRFVFGPLNTGIQEGGRMPAELSALLAYTLPLRQLYITGRDQDRERWLSKAEVEETVAAEDYRPEGRTVNELFEDLTNWSPNVRYAASMALAGREDAQALFLRLGKLANNPHQPRTARAHACTILGKIGDEESAEILVALLRDKDNWVRYAAANALREMAQTIKMKYVNEFLRAVVDTARPTFPLDRDDPLQQAHGELAMILFYNGNAYGPRGILSNSIEGVDRSLLLPAIRAVAMTASGLRRSTLRSVYPKLTYEEVLKLAPTIVESVRTVAPADAMFSAGVQIAGAKLLEAQKIADGVPLLKVCDYRIKKVTPDILAGYAGGVLTVKPDPGALDFLYEKLYVHGDTKAEKAIDAVLSDTNPTRLKPLKVIHSVTAEPPALTLPAAATTLRVAATNYARPGEKNTFYSWRKVYGAGQVAFKPDKTRDSRTTSVHFIDKRPGRYRFEVTMSDVLGYTIVRDTVDVTFYSEDGKLPPNRPPQAHSQLLNAIPGLPVAVTLTASDPEQQDLAFQLQTGPQHGQLSGTPPDLSYVADFGYTGEDAFTFNVVDGQGVISTGTVSMKVENNDVGLTVYEGFNYPEGELNGQSGHSEIGLDGQWTVAGDRAAYIVCNGSFGHTNLPSSGGKLNSKGGRSPATRPINLPAIQRDGLLENGGDLWFSAVMGRHEKINFRNSSLSVGLKDREAPETADVGLFWSTMSTHAAINGKHGRSATGWPGWKVVFSADTPLLFVGHCAWSADDEQPDRVAIYRVIEDRNGQLIRLNNPVSTCSAVVDQGRLNTLYFHYSGGFMLDEIRVGPTYESVILGTISTQSPHN